MKINFKKLFTNHQHGFTFIEILVVVTIIGVLMSIGTVSFQAANKKSRDARRKADLEQLRAAIEMYKADNGFYPDYRIKVDGLDSLTSLLQTAGYLQSGIKDPINTTGDNPYPCGYATNYRYNYAGLPATGIDACTPVDQCYKYFLTAIMENESSKDDSPCEGTVVEDFCTTGLITEDVCYAVFNP